MSKRIGDMMGLELEKSAGNMLELTTRPTFWDAYERLEWVIQMDLRGVFSAEGLQDSHLRELSVRKCSGP